MAKTKKTAAGVGSTYDGRPDIHGPIIEPPAENVNQEAVPTTGAASWRLEAAQKEISENAQISALLRQAMMLGLPVEYRGITYRRITGLILRPHPHGGIRLQAELLDQNGRTVIIARPREVIVPEPEDVQEEKQ